MKWLFIHCFQIKLEFGKFGFCGGRTCPTANWTHLWRRVQDLNLGHTGGRPALSPLCHPFSRITDIIIKCDVLFLPQGAQGLRGEVGERGETGLSVSIWKFTRCLTTYVNKSKINVYVCAWHYQLNFKQFFLLKYYILIIFWKAKMNLKFEKNTECSIHYWVIFRL